MSDSNCESLVDMLILCYMVVKKILLFEDDEAVAFLYKMVLSKRNYAIDIAANGDLGLQKVREQKPDLILLDIMMPEKSGMEVIEELKRDPETQNIPIYVLSNLADKTIEQKVMELGALKYLIKSQYLPTDIADLIDNHLWNLTT